MNLLKLIDMTVLFLIATFLLAFSVNMTGAGPIFIFFGAAIAIPFLRFPLLKEFSKNYLSLYCFIFFLLVLTQPLLFAQSKPVATNNKLKVKSTADFVVTGDGSSERWKNTEWNILPQRSSETLINTGWNIPPQRSATTDLQYETSFKILYSNKGIYCLFKCEDSVITATLKEDFLSLFNEDVVEVFLRPDSIIPAYFEYELSPLNFELPILILNNKGKSSGWRPWPYRGSRKIMHAIKINEKNPVNNRFTWTAEIYIPFTLLEAMDNVPPKKGTQWRANFYRIDYDRNPVYSAWKLTRGSFHDPEKFGILEFE
ncbi:MAG: carbohydrate-binding family 9-like protein [Ginsengibacter sp.]